MLLVKLLIISKPAWITSSTCYTLKGLQNVICLGFSSVEISRNKASFSYYRFKLAKSHTLTAALERFVNFLIGLRVYFTVVTGANAKNILILLASSGFVENAMKAERVDDTSL